LAQDVGPGIWLILPSYTEKTHIWEFLSVLQQFVTSIGASPSSTNSIFEHICTGGTSHASNEFYGIDTIAFSPGIARNWRLKENFSILVLQSLKGTFALRFLDREVKTEKEWTIMYALYKLARGNTARGTSGDRVNAVMDLIIRPEDERYNKYYNELYDINKDMNEKSCWTLWYDSNVGQQKEIHVRDDKGTEQEADVGTDDETCLVPNASKKDSEKEEIPRADQDAKQERGPREEVAKVAKDAKEEAYTNQEDYAGGGDYADDGDYAEHEGYAVKEGHTDEEKHAKDEQYPKEKEYPEEIDGLGRKADSKEEKYMEEVQKGDEEATRANKEDLPREAEEKHTRVEQHTKEEWDIVDEKENATIAVNTGENDDMARNNQEEPSEEEQTEKEQTEDEQQGEKAHSNNGLSAKEQIKDHQIEEEQLDERFEMEPSAIEQTEEQTEKEVDKGRNGEEQVGGLLREEVQNDKGQNRKEQNIDCQNRNCQNCQNEMGQGEGQGGKFQNDEQSEQSQDKIQSEEGGDLEFRLREGAENHHDYNIRNWLHGWNNLGWPVVWWEDMSIYG
jgi:hypothetical protein